MNLSPLNPTAVVPHIIRNGSTGFDIIKGSQPYNVLIQLSPTAVRAFETSHGGKYIIYTDDEFRGIKIFDLESLKEVKGIKTDRKPHHIRLSPKGTILAIWFQYKSPPQGTADEPNMWMIDLKSLLDGKTGPNVVDINDLVIKAKLVVKSNAKWCPEWTDDEHLCVRHFHSEIMVFEDHNYDRWVHKNNQIKVNSFSIKRNLLDGKYYISTFSIGSKGQPSFVKIFRYPKSKEDKLEASLIVSKSFFRGDSVKYIWSPIGTSLLILAITESDKSGKSYYGTQMLHYMDIKGVNNSPQLNKEGPIHDVDWVPIHGSKLSNTSNPSELKTLDGGQLFAVIYGYMPAKVGLFNSKCELVFDFNDESYSVNQISFNPFGNILITAGFGNLRGGIYVWDMSKKSAPQETSKPQALPLIANFKCPETTNLSWSDDGMTIMTSTTAPRLRVGNGFKLWKYTGLNLHEQCHATTVEVYQVQFQERPSSFSEPVLRQTFAKPVKVVENAPKYVPPSQRDKETYLKQVKELSSRAKVDTSKSSGEDAAKKVKNIEKKLKDIQKLRLEQNSGKVLEKNQLEKIEKENELINELEYLKLHS